ncbi:transcriptional regulator family: Fungal Specific TF [Trichoderma aggressivum f. europaeum]|uniref:Transcriptional regulator family: Fungal Specific TF n=1 Tax=Trichoderma aggressivum f. europaeum TaxID=173218 RepID=A0AAE1IKE8_9HYPO|nr:transcriptional regulator family: Fungal Specific TF [Trichoderma aggressivum f. europaeum]
MQDEDFAANAASQPDVGIVAIRIHGDAFLKGQDLAAKVHPKGRADGTSAVKSVRGGSKWTAGAHRGAARGTLPSTAIRRKHTPAPGSTRPSVPRAGLKGPQTLDGRTVAWRMLDSAFFFTISSAGILASPVVGLDWTAGFFCDFFAARVVRLLFTMGCRVCRARKVKCDGRPNGCRNCERLQLDCVGDNGLAAGRATPMSLRKIRTYRSCKSCRLSKTKCNGDRPKCSRCAAKKTECVYDGGSAPRWARNLDRGSRTASTEGSRSKSRELAIAMLEASDEADAQDDTPMTSIGSAEPLKLGDITGSKALGSARSVASIEPSGSDILSWLNSPSLPTGRNLRRVVEQYFANVHPIRCFAFVHKPSFMRQLDKGFTSDDESALLHIICAHGAKFYVLNQNEHASASSFIRLAGNEWAKRAEFLILTNFGKISVQRLMVAILLHDFHFRLGEYSHALMLSGLAVRMAHALKINVEASPDVLCTDSSESAPSVVTRESRRRLMWACYVLDAWAGSGIDQLTLLRENDIKIQLPTNERNFGLRIASVTETLGVGHVLQFLPPSVVPRKPSANMGIMAYYIRVVALWKRIVRYVNQLDSNPPPWLPESPFAALDADLRLWQRELPEFVEYSMETIYARLDSNQLGALVLIHCTYHHNYLELYKLSMPDLFKLPKPLVVPPEHHEFLQSAQANCYHHAQQIADILAEAADHGANLLSDSLLPYFVYDSSRVMLYYVARLLDPNRPDAQSKLGDAINAVESNRRVLRMMSALFPIAQSLSNTIDRWLTKIRQTSNRDDLVSRILSEARSETQEGEKSTPVSVSPVQGTPEYMLPSISLHSLARTGIATRRAADRASGVRGLSWSAESPSSGTWDRNNAAQQLVGLSQDGLTSSRSGLQHEQPVPTALPQPPPIQAKWGGPIQPMFEALDLDDLQNFLSWDMYGIMDMGDPIPDDGAEEMGLRSWSGSSDAI